MQYKDVSKQCSVGDTIYANIYFMNPKLLQRRAKKDTIPIRTRKYLYARVSSYRNTLPFPPLFENKIKHIKFACVTNKDV
jgi:hypothetical protein